MNKIIVSNYAKIAKEYTVQGIKSAAKGDAEAAATYFEMADEQLAKAISECGVETN